MESESSTERRVRMPDGEWWTVRFQHEMAQVMRRGRERERALLVFFHHARGALRRAAVPESFKQAATDDELRNAWRRAEQLAHESGERRSG